MRENKCEYCNERYDEKDSRARDYERFCSYECEKNNEKYENNKRKK